MPARSRFGEGSGEGEEKFQIFLDRTYLITGHWPMIIDD
jgi:hypothetical protein